MAAEANGNIYANLARLDEEAAHAGCAMACAHQSADELHKDMIQRYFALHPRRRPFGLAVGVTMLAVFLILI
jgi:hypothetical protein